jgi:Xaa-Pro aminopeptidase
VRTRIERTQAQLGDRDLSALLAGPSSDLFWLVGYHALPLERLTLLVVPQAGRPILLVPELEEPRAKQSGADRHADIVTWSESEDPVAAVVSRLDRLECPPDGAYAVQDQLWSAFLLRLQEALPRARWAEGGEVMRDLRVRKEPEEIDALAAAATAIDRVHAQVPQMLQTGRTEREIARDIADAILVEHDEVNFTIVASGPNGASPHHETGKRTVSEGDAVVIDVGGTLRGYCSDMTRNYVVGSVPSGYRYVHDVVVEAQQAGVDAIRPGVSAESVDAAARAVITEAGWGDCFIHRTGHGIGVDGHEHPYIVAGNSETLEEGMVFSVEPGVYVPGRFGARIEDIVVVTEDGARRLNRLAHEVVEVRS